MYLIHRQQDCWIFYLSFFVALLLQVVSWPDDICLFRPNWVFLIFFYWSLSFPYRVGIGASFVAGLVLDLVSGSTLGIHALALSIISYFVSIRFYFFRNLVLWQQAIAVTLLSLADNIIVFLGEFFVISTSFRSEIFFNSLVNGFLWPWFRLIFQKIRKN